MVRISKYGIHITEYKVYSLYVIEITQGKKDQVLPVGTWLSTPGPER